MVSKNSKQILFERMNKVAGMPLKEYNNWDYPAGADADPSAPWHQSDPPEIQDWEYDGNNNLTFHADQNTEPHYEDLEDVIPEDAHDVWSAIEADPNADITQLIKPYVEAWISNNESSIEWDFNDPRDDMYENQGIGENKSDILAGEINKAMIGIDESMGVQDFAMAIGKILKEQYGEHNYQQFMGVLHKILGVN